MSFGAGHMLDMINRIKQNAALKTSRRKKFKNNRDNMYSSDFEKVVYDFPKISKARLAEIKNNIRTEAKRKNRKHLIALLFLSALVLIPVILFILRL